MFHLKGWRPAAVWMVWLGILASCAGCTTGHLASKTASSLFAASSQSFASDDDPELIEEASTFGLKLAEALVLSRPQDRELLLSACRGFAQYAFAFVQQKGEEIEDKNLEMAQHYYQRARKLYRRAMSYGWRGLDMSLPKSQEALHRNLPAALKRFKREDVPWLYWTAVSMGALINLSKDSAELLADIPVMEGIIDRAFELDEGFEAGAIHQFLISYEMQRRHRKGDPVQLAKAHFHRAVDLSQGRYAANYVVLAESVMVKLQDRGEFNRLLNAALRVDTDAAPHWRLANLLWQQRARWLLGRESLLFSE